jgi:phage terminase large subunit-like protein
MRDALELLRSLVLEDGRRWGDVAQPWQLEDAEAVLALPPPRGGGSGRTPRGVAPVRGAPFASEPYHFLTRGRGGAKTSDLAGVAIAAMLTQAPSSARLYGLAADRDQARLLIDSVRGYVERTPELRGQLSVDTWRVTAARDVVLEALAADAASSWGLRPWFVVADEIAQWNSTGGPRVLWESVSSAAAKNPECRMVLLTSAGDPAHWSRGVLEHAERDPLWRVHEVPGPVPWLDPARVEEQRRRLSESSFARLFLNQWTAGEDRVASLDDLRACVTLDGPQEPREGVAYVIGVDLGLKRDRTAVCICHGERLRGDADPVVGARVVLDRLQTWQGTRLKPVQLDDVENWVAAASEKYNHAGVILDPWQAAGLAQRLQARGVRRTGWSGRDAWSWKVEEFAFSAQSVGRLASTLTLLIRNHALALPDDKELIDELANLRLRETAPGVLRIDHDPDKHDDQAIALALAAQRLAGGVWTQPEQAAQVEWATPRDRMIHEFWEQEDAGVRRARVGVDYRWA